MARFQDAGCSAEAWSSAKSLALALRTRRCQSADRILRTGASLINSSLQCRRSLCSESASSLAITGQTNCALQQLHHEQLARRLRDVGADLQCTPKDGSSRSDHVVVDGPVTPRKRGEPEPFAPGSGLHYQCQPARHPVVRFVCAVGHCL